MTFYLLFSLKMFFQPHLHCQKWIHNLATEQESVYHESVASDLEMVFLPRFVKIK